MTSNEHKVKKTGLRRLVAPLVEIFGLSWKLASATMLFVVAVLGLAIFWFFHSAAPTTFTITTGPRGSIFETNAVKYATILWRDHRITLKILTSEGSEENLKRLNDRSSGVDVGFIQGGVTNGLDEHGKATNILVSLGSVYDQPLLIFYRGTNSTGLLSELAGKRIVVGPVGSGTRPLALAMLQMNAIAPGGKTELLDWDADKATKALIRGEIDAVFLMGDSASASVMRQLFAAPGVQLMDLAQAEGYSRKITYLNRMVLPRGTFDFAKDMPPHDIQLVGPTVELIARPKLHPALIDLLLEAAKEVHGPAGIFRRRGEFPADEEHDFQISPESERWHKNGRTFLYRTLPFSLASLVNQVLVAIVPVLVLLIPGLKLIPAIFKWRVKLLFYRWYRALLAVEKQLSQPMTPAKREELTAELDHIERGVNRMKVPPTFAGDFYSLRGNVEFVRELLKEQEQSK